LIFKYVLGIKEEDAETQISTVPLANTNASRVESGDQVTEWTLNSSNASIRRRLAASQILTIPLLDKDTRNAELGD
jgi:hypothetical protein